MQSTFQGISDILKNLDATVSTATSKNTIMKCTDLIQNIQNICNHECTTNNVLNCTYTMQTDLIENISTIQRVLYDSDEHLNSALATNEIVEVIKEVIKVTQHRRNFVL